MHSEGKTVTTGLVFELDDDCGICDIGSLEHARRRVLGTSAAALPAHAAAERGCGTASLQSTPIAEVIYAAVGFRDLGRILEYGLPGQ